MLRMLVIALGFLGVLATPCVHAQALWNSQDYNVYAGDFNGDGKTDFLVIAKSPSGISGIYLSDGNGPNIPWQIWPSNYLGIAWSGNQYNVIVADFNGDGKSDIFLQGVSPGDCYLLITDSTGRISAISQTIPSSAMGLVWTADQHRIVAGDFNHDGKADLFLQATSRSGINAVVLADSNGQFTSSAPAQTWNDGYLGLGWSTFESIVYAGDFNGDGYADLLIQAKPAWIPIEYSPTFLAPFFTPNKNGVVYAQAGSTIFGATHMQAWSETYDGVNWSPLLDTVVVGDFNPGTTTDILLQAAQSGNPSYLLSGNTSGAAFATGVALPNNVTWSSDTYTLITANFGDSSTAGVYFLRTTSSGTDYYASSINGSTVTLTTQSPALVNGTTYYTYDALGRLTTVAHSTVNSNVQTTYIHDAAGNRRTKAVSIASH